MKLLRYGTAGEEKPGLIDADGGIRSLDGVVKDLAGESLSSASIASLSAIDAPHAAAGSRANRVWGHASPASARLFASARTTPITPPRPAVPCRESRSCS